MVVNRISALQCAGEIYLSAGKWTAADACSINLKVLPNLYLFIPSPPLDSPQMTALFQL